MQLLGDLFVAIQKSTKDAGTMSATKKMKNELSLDPVFPFLNFPVILQNVFSFQIKNKLIKSVCQ